MPQHVPTTAGKVWGMDHVQSLWTCSELLRGKKLVTPEPWHDALRILLIEGPKPDIQWGRGLESQLILQDLLRKSLARNMPNLIGFEHKRLAALMVARFCDRLQRDLTGWTPVAPFMQLRTRLSRTPVDIQIEGALVGPQGTLRVLTASRARSAAGAARSGLTALQGHVAQQAIAPDLDVEVYALGLGARRDFPMQPQNFVPFAHIVNVGDVKRRLPALQAKVREYEATGGAPQWHCPLKKACPNFSNCKW